MKRIKQDSRPMQQEQWLVASTCQVCKTAIDQGTPRTIVAAVKFAFEVDANNPSGSQLSQASIAGGSSSGEQGSWKVGKLISYCNDCAEGIDDFIISNPWSLVKRTPSKQVSGSASLDTRGAEMNAEAAATHKTVSESLAPDDTRRLTPTHSVPVDIDLAAKSAVGKLRGKALEATPEITKEPVAAHSGNAGATGSSSSGERKQRAKLLKFLNAPASQGMRPQMRQAGRHWAEGSSQGDVARKLNMDPSTVARMINGALKMADARG